MGPVTHPTESGSNKDFASVLDQLLEEKSSSESLPNEQQCEKEDELDSEIHRTKKRTAELISETVECEHPGFFGGLCVKCGQIANGQSDVQLEYTYKKLKFSKGEIAGIRERDMKRLLHHKKLYLVLDLDHTLANSAPSGDLSVYEEYLKSQTDSRQDLFVLEAADMMMTKLRPFVHTFLKEASKMFDMYLYTMGGHTYALEMAKLLDPKMEYFNSKVISREEGTEEDRKNLDMLMGQKTVTLILDDSELVWRDFKDNLMVINQYHFFSMSRRHYRLSGKSLAERREDESESGGALSNALELLKWIHDAFFLDTGDDFAAKDVRKIMRNENMKDRLLTQKILKEPLKEQLVIKKTSQDPNQTEKSEGPA